MTTPNSPMQLDLLAEEAPTPATRGARRSAFTGTGFRATVEALEEEIRTLYGEDDAPWIVGYSGGKDSTATLQLIWSAIAALPVGRRRKTIHVISTDTLVENPVVSAWVEGSIRSMRTAAQEQRMPVQPQMLRPRLSDRFWVNLIGRGYPAPRPKFRWCTERLKIRPSNNFISRIVTKNGEAILCLGARRTESIARLRVFENAQRFRVRDRLSPSETLAGCLVYTPIEVWTSDDVWLYLTNTKNPWGVSNKELMGLYAGASPDGECPLVVDESTPSCGDSRFGCWVCTLVEKDKSMAAMIHNDSAKDWLEPLLELRNDLDARNQGEKAAKASDHHLRDFRRMTGAVQVMPNGDPVPGPYTQEARVMWLRKVLEAQKEVCKRKPSSIAEIQLITHEELQEIRRIWVMEKHELEDRLPGIYQEVTGEPYPGGPLDDSLSLGADEMAILRDLCGDDRLHFELVRELLSVTRQQRTSARRANLSQRIEQAFSRHYYDSSEEAIETARSRADARTALVKLKTERDWFAGTGGEVPAPAEGEPAAPSVDSPARV
jgi:DNA sulfur modification protein DndC